MAIDCHMKLTFNVLPSFDFAFHDSFDGDSGIIYSSSSTENRAIIRIT